MRARFLAFLCVLLAPAALAVSLTVPTTARAQSLDRSVLGSPRGEIPVCCQVGTRKWKTSRQDCRRRRNSRILLLSACQPKVDPKQIPGTRGTLRICCLKGGHVSRVTPQNCRRHPHAKIVTANVCDGTVCCKRGKEFFHTTGLRCSRRRDQQVLSRAECLRIGVCCQIEPRPRIPPERFGTRRIWTTRGQCDRQQGTVVLNQLCANRPYD